MMNAWIQSALHYQGPRLTFMEVCGTHSTAVAQYGLKALLPPSVRLISGPGCPVCVTSAEDMDALHAFMARNPDSILATFGDMLRVPASGGRTLEDLRTSGADIRIVHSATASLELARLSPGRRVVFCAVGFETTAPGTAAALREAKEAGIDNWSVLSLHKTMPPALRCLLAEACHVDGFILPGHVCAVTGPGAFHFLPREFGVSGVISGFEPADILESLGMLITKVQNGTPEVQVQYRRAVFSAGNEEACSALEAVFEPCDAGWRGFGLIPASGLRPRTPYLLWAAQLPLVPTSATTDCLCGDILRGVREPRDCSHFAEACTPRHPLGPCMVSAEGVCAVHFRYREGAK